MRRKRKMNLNDSKMFSREKESRESNERPRITREGEEHPWDGRTRSFNVRRKNFSLPHNEFTKGDNDYHTLGTVNPRRASLARNRSY